MKRLHRLALLTLAVSVASAAHAQIGWGNDCIDPENTQPRSTDHGARTIQNPFIIHSVGTSGTVTYGGQNGPCYAPSARTLALPGRLGFMIGSVGSLQTDFDDFMTLTVGMPRDPAGDYGFVRIIRQTGTSDPETILFGEGGVNQFVGLSQRYMITTWSNGETQVELLSRVIGDAVRLRWQMRNLSTTESQSLGMKFAAHLGFRTANPGVQDQFGHNQSQSLLGGASSVPRPTQIGGADGDVRRRGSVGFIEIPTDRPLRTEKNYLRSNPRFPDFVNFQWSQWEPYGFRLDNVPTDATPDQESADQILIGTGGWIGDTRGILFDGDTQAGVMNGRVSTDFAAGDPALNPAITNVREDSDTPIWETAFVQAFRARPVGPGQVREIVQYIRSPWSVADYLDPYSVVVDAPRLLESAPGELNDLSPNPMTIAAYIDNQYSQVNFEVPLTDVQYTIFLEEDSGLRLAPGESPTKTLASIAPNGIGSVTWQVEADGTRFGRLPFRVRFRPGNSLSKELTGSVLVSATPQVRLPEGASLVTIPWSFGDTSLDAIFGPQGDPDALRFGVDYLAYRWDPITGQYLPQTSALRGQSLWIVALNDFGRRALAGAALPSDMSTGGQVTTLQPGWNMIGNPYPYAVPLSQLLGVGLADPTAALSWQQLVENGWVSPSLAFWERDPQDPTSGFYRFTEGSTDLLQPSRGYWILVNTPQTIRLSWPPVFLPGLSNTTRKADTPSATAQWRQSDRQWRLQLVARTQDGIDPQNFVGVAANADAAKSLRRFEPPTAPNADVELTIREQVDGRVARLASSFTDSTARKSWTVLARAEKEGEVTITWPNISSVPRNVRFTLKDVASDTTRDLRFQSSYTFRTEGPTTREFVLTMEPAGAQRALIGNVTVSRPSRDTNGPVVINYTLSSEAMTSVRILSGSGREVLLMQRGRAAQSGENSVTWNLRDSANRAVAPGTYQVEIIAETSNGERVRRIVPINVVR